LVETQAGEQHPYASVGFTPRTMNPSPSMRCLHASWRWRATELFGSRSPFFSSLLANVVAMHPRVFLVAVLCLKEDIFVVFTRDNSHAARDLF
jgi:hypothetical protein